MFFFRIKKSPTRQIQDESTQVLPGSGSLRVTEFASIHLLFLPKNPWRIHGRWMYISLHFMVKCFRIIISQDPWDWYMYLHGRLIFMGFHVGKYTSSSHGSVMGNKDTHHRHQKRRIGLSLNGKCWHVTGSMAWTDHSLPPKNQHQQGFPKGPIRRNFPNDF